MLHVAPAEVAVTWRVLRRSVHGAIDLCHFGDVVVGFFSENDEVVDATLKVGTDDVCRYSLAKDRVVLALGDASVLPMLALHHESASLVVSVSTSTSTSPSSSPSPSAGSGYDVGVWVVYADLHPRIRRGLHPPGPVSTPIGDGRRVVFERGHASVTSP